MIPKQYVDLANEIYTKGSSAITIGVNDDSLVDTLKKLSDDIIKESNLEQRFIPSLALRAICAEILWRHGYTVVCLEVNQPIVFST